MTAQTEARFSATRGFQEEAERIATASSDEIFGLKNWYGIVKLSRSQCDHRQFLHEHGYKGHRFPPEIISHSVWLCHRFTLSFRDVEGLLAERGVTVSYESIRN